MQKLLNKFVETPTFENARKLATYSNKYPMASCMLTPMQVAALNHAIVMAANATKD